MMTLIQSLGESAAGGPARPTISPYSQGVMLGTRVNKPAYPTRNHESTDPDCIDIKK